MAHRRPRPLAICVFRDADRIFVFEGVDTVKDEVFYRPLGGAIEFGEHSRDTVVRELREELGAEVEGLRFVATLENRFTYLGEPGHEIVLVYEAAFQDPRFYEGDSFEGVEDDGVPFRALWMPLAHFREGRAPLYPDGLLELLDNMP